jgi:type II secretory ATPase GspE/PulE/Tfp pilus assembly ATPase PilB-like protein/ActR/RegA family two-component response regulator
MPDQRGSQHWLIGVLKRGGGDIPPDFDLPARTETADAWTKVAKAMGLSFEEIARLVAARHRLEVADLTSGDSRVLRLVPDTFARRHQVLPLQETDRELTVATSDPTDLEVEQGLGFASGRAPIFAIAAPDALKRAIDKAYSPNHMMASLLEGIDDLDPDQVRLVESTEVEKVGIEEAEAEPVVKLTSLVLRDAINQRASDIHFEPGRDGGKIRFRVDGVMRRHMQLPMTALNRVLSRIKIMGNLDIADRMRPQDGRARIVVDKKEYDLRISTVPTREAEKAVIRVLSSVTAMGLADVGMTKPEFDRVTKILGQRDGIIIVTGPTGSGKSTTLYAALRDLATEDVNVMTVEDPVEYEVKGITQIQVETKRGVTFGSALRAILRQDPDVILIGEIRDLETAEVAVQASMTGHLVLATLHTNDAVGAVQRLVDIGLDRPSIAEALRGVLAQRLVRRLCSYCAVPAETPLPEEEGVLAARHGVAPRMMAVGCDECGNTGYRGRLPILELLTVDETIRQLVVKEASTNELRQAAIAGGMRLLEEVAMDPVAEGLTTLTEIARELGEPEALVRQDADDAPHILLVDDDAVNRTLAKTLLAKNGFRTSEAEDGQEAVELLSGPNSFSLVVLDLDMPRMGGRDVLKKIRRTVATAGLPVVVLTGTHDKESEIELMDMGADDYIRKPIDPPRFVTRLKAALRRAGG